MDSTPTVPASYNYAKPKDLAVPAQSIRSSVVPGPSNEFGPGTKMIFQLPTGSPGTHWNTSESYLQFDVFNNSTTSLTLTGTAHSCIQSIDTYFGSTHVASNDQFGELCQMLMDTQASTSSRMTTNTIMGSSDYLPISGNVILDAVDAYYSRDGARIEAGERKTVCLPLPYCLGSLAQKSIPLGVIRDGLRVEVKVAPLPKWGVTGNGLSTGSFKLDNVKYQMSLVQLADSVEQALVRSIPRIIIPTSNWHHAQTTVQSGSINFTLPWKMASANAIFAIIRADSSVESAAVHGNLRTRADASYFYLKIGAHNVPQERISLANGAAEGRMELMKALQSVDMADAPSTLSSAVYDEEGFVMGLSLSAFGLSDILSDGRVLRDEAVQFVCDTKAGVSIIVDFFCQADMLLEVSDGIVSFSE